MKRNRLLSTRSSGITSKSRSRTENEREREPPEQGKVDLSKRDEFISITVQSKEIMYIIIVLITLYIYTFIQFKIIMKFHTIKYK